MDASSVGWHMDAGVSSHTPHWSGARTSRTPMGSWLVRPHHRSVGSAGAVAHCAKLIAELFHPRFYPTKCARARSGDVSSDRVARRVVYRCLMVLEGWLVRLELMPEVVPAYSPTLKLLQVGGPAAHCAHGALARAGLRLCSICPAPAFRLQRRPLQVHQCCRAGSGLRPLRGRWLSEVREFAACARNPAHG